MTCHEAQHIRKPSTGRQTLRHSLSHSVPESQPGMQTGATSVLEFVNRDVQLHCNQSVGKGQAHEMSSSGCARLPLAGHVSPPQDPALKSSRRQPSVSPTRRMNTCTVGLFLHIKGTKFMNNLCKIQAAI
eukprot:1727414-Amphidinium_carterae.3